VSAAKDFQSLSKKLGDIRPDNIFINEDGQVKLANVHSWPNEDDNYMKTLLNNEATYLGTHLPNQAPEEVRELQNGKSQSGPNCDPNIAEAFSIGLTIIDAGLLGDCSKIYNFKANRFD
jgi:Golgi nucleoside diphosphatase